MTTTTDKSYLGPPDTNRSYIVVQLDHGIDDEYGTVYGLSRTQASELILYRRWLRDNGSELLKDKEWRLV